MYTEELGYGSTHEVEALEIEVGSPAMRSKKHACCRIVMWAVITDMFTCHGVRRVGVRGEVSGSNVYMLMAPSNFKSDFALKGISLVM